MNDLTHFSDSGRARIVDISEKRVTVRVATAAGILRMRTATLARIRANAIAKGNVLAVADVAAVMAAKQTPTIIPMCHAISLAGVEIAFEDVIERDAENCPGIRVVATVTSIGQTGVEMEALCAANVALLTIYDMCKAIDRGMRIESVQLLEKRGGKSGIWKRSVAS
ncbi:cyclic pyranopterin monophosphate synthase MoaC [Propionivibrio dicarboxylicus]|uniref:Cyclic pyranopterin monophosphate synthase n=1 Tax=Propionivibrio dicarboxylicus TaxID=83767 RepID=A0A1G8KFV8_9RHOO|nr:cyclic pyranopterin monophosphate synthase MoaC [Propionivibrio dicarboxylicus]SDI42343.1 cyclic pyranopterin phosphate synthase [Propionivibrio dicarboxylicus]